MGRKAKISYEIKIKFVEEYLNGNISQNSIAKELGLHLSSIQEWIRKYKTFGPEGLITIEKNMYYNSELKLSAVRDYINGTGSLADICLKYKGDHIMTNGRKTTYEERIEIVSFCIANAHDYNLTSNKFNVSYQQVYTWVKKYNKNGYNVLVDRRGKNKPFEELTESEKFSAQLKLLEAENRRLKMENDFLKKLEEIERR